MSATHTAMLNPLLHAGLPEKKPILLAFESCFSTSGQQSQHTTKSLLYYYVMLLLLSLTPSSTVAYLIIFLLLFLQSFPTLVSPWAHWLMLKTFLLVTIKKASQAFINVSAATISHMPVVNLLMFDVPTMVSCNKHQFLDFWHAAFSALQSQCLWKIRWHTLPWACFVALRNSAPGPKLF